MRKAFCSAKSLVLPTPYPNLDLAGIVLFRSILLGIWQNWYILDLKLYWSFAVYSQALQRGGKGQHHHLKFRWGQDPLRPPKYLFFERRLRRAKNLRKGAAKTLIISPPARSSATWEVSLILLPQNNRTSLVKWEMMFHKYYNSFTWENCRTLLQIIIKHSYQHWQLLLYIEGFYFQNVTGSKNPIRDVNTFLLNRVLG